jgi:hypothetical protein
VSERFALTHAILLGVLANVRPARATLVACIFSTSFVAAACSLFAPTDAELIGGGGAPQEGGKPSAGATSGSSNGGASGGSGGSAGSGDDSTAAGGEGGATSGGGEAGGGGRGGSVPVAGATGCIRDVSSSEPPASSLGDDFSDGTAGPNFRVDGDTETCALEASGRVEVALPPSVSGYFCYYETLANYDLTCDSIVVKVAEAAGPVVGLQTYLYVGPDAAHRVMVVVENGGYLFSTNGTQFSSVGRFDPASPWWRLREAEVGGQRKVIFETSPDAATWTERHSVTRPFALNKVKVAFGAGAHLPTADGGTGAFACYNAPAGCD